jgi:hypothetical protein
MAEISTLSPMGVARQAVGLLVLALGLVSPAAATAQSGDPAEGSPSGVIYEIPLDNARHDAAPTHLTGGSGGGPGSGGGSGSQGSAGAGAQGGTASPIRSENGFGSSSTVPGAATVAPPKAKSGGKGGTSGSGAKGAGTPTPAGSSGSMSAAVAESLGAPRSATVTPSKSRAYLLLLLALLVAAGLGVAGRYVARRR